MTHPTRRTLATRLLPAAALTLAATTPLLRPTPAQAATRAEIDADVTAALTRLRNLPQARALHEQARATLIFPRIIQGGFVVGGQYGEGALLQGGTTRGYFNIAGASFGLLIGAQASGLAMFFMTEEALRNLMNAEGWEIGTGPAVVVLDRGAQINATSTTLREPVYAVTFNQEGLMASIALNGTKITQIRPS